MDFFCPYCQKRLPSKRNIVVEVPNDDLKEVLLGLSSDTKESISDNYDACINALFNKMATVPFLCGSVTMEPNGLYGFKADGNDFVTAVSFAVKYWNKRREKDGREHVAILGMTDELFRQAEVLTDNIQKQAGAFPNRYYGEYRAGFGADKNNEQILEYVSKRGRNLSKRCGECHQPLFQSAGLGREIVIGLLGSERVGKSTCIAATIQNFLISANGMSRDAFHFALPDNDERWRKTVQKPLLDRYNAGWAVRKTDLNVEGTAFCATIQAIGAEPLILTFIDMPGEYMHAKGTGNVDTKWVDNYLDLYKEVDVFWFCIDGSQLTQSITAEGGYNQRNEYDMAHLVDVDILNRNLSFMQARIVQRKKELGKGDFMSPAAIIFTKSDEASGHTDDPSIWWRGITPNSIYQQGTDSEEGLVSKGRCGTISEKAFTHQCASVTFALNSIGLGTPAQMHAQKILGVINAVFPEAAYFSTSAYSRAARHKPMLAYIINEALFCKDDETGNWVEFALVSQLGKQSDGMYFGRSISTSHIVCNRDGTRIPQEQEIPVAIFGQYGTLDELKMAEPLSEMSRCPEGSPTPFHARLPLYWTLAVLGEFDVNIEITQRPRRKVTFKTMKEIQDTVKPRRVDGTEFECRARRNLCNPNYQEHIQWI